MTSISIQFQLNDQQPVAASLPANFTLADFKSAADKVYNNTSFLYSFVCHGKEFELNDEDKFNNYKALITSGTTIFTIEHHKCFLPDTLIQCADQNEINIQDVQLGDALLAFTTFGEIVTTTVEEVFKHEVDEYVELQIGENRVNVTREHPFFIGNGNFCSLDKLRVSDCIYSLIDDHLQSTTITNIKTVKAPKTCVYNLRTSQPHTYFANKIAVHNKLGTTFVDLSKGNGLKRIEFSPTAPSWRIARPGICIEGKCSNQSCRAYKQMVVVNIGIREFNLLNESHKMSKCPECSRYVEPITCAFNNCIWRWEGLLQSGTDTEPREVSGDWKRADNAYHRFDENVNEAAVWRQLNLYAQTK
ncbi:unnamed protein product [Rotaria sordida]|uniref:Hint domain-containing protein n=1 Tax=Rotaria sordida TaxID=392033 RepID=A0A815CKN1_9BILA|nr:unnamed protein product [Rotaria sordida]CAF1286433.1 unnamed protein product [Rotaria sordida]CAF4158375.1 unnamed protein product [Rotaria sordida]CAF4203274.1 unnamed protein product [Rotaria sordida]